MKLIKTLRGPVLEDPGPSMFETDAKTFIRHRELSEDQNFPQSAMPRELQDANPRKIWRLVDGEVTKDAL